jgi:hypothetical protein
LNVIGYEALAELLSYDPTGGSPTIAQSEEAAGEAERLKMQSSLLLSEDARS